MTRNTLVARLALFCSLFGVCSGQVLSQTAQSGSKASTPPPSEESQKKTEQIRLKLTDGTFLIVDDAWETAQGTWYRQGGISHLAPRERVKGVERSAQTPAPKAVSETPKPLIVRSTQPGVFDTPAWIYLVGGARVEADTATETPAGVWYKRGPLQIFIDHSRIDHVEAEEVENLAESDSSQKRERGWSTGSPKLDALIRQNGSKYGVDPYLVFLVMEQESHFNTRVVSPKGAAGLMQLMPGTARFGVRHPMTPPRTSPGHRYLKQLLDRFNNRVDLVLASYNAGEVLSSPGHKVPLSRNT